MLLNMVKGLVKLSSLWAVWSGCVTKTAFWKIACLYVSVLGRLQQGHATVQVAMFNVARDDITLSYFDQLANIA